MNELAAQIVSGNPSDVGRPPDPRRPIPLVVATLLSAVLLLVSAVMFAAGASTENIPLLFGGLASAVLYLSILIGLIKRQEWARIMLIWLCYVGIASYGYQCLAVPRAMPILVPLLGLEIVTLVFAHHPSVRQTTKGVSLAKAYTYHEQVQTGKEEV